MSFTHRLGKLSLICLFSLAFLPVCAVGDDSLIVTENGNVGIGTTIPSGRLQIQGKLRLGANYHTWNEENNQLGIYFQSKGANSSNPNVLHTAGRIYGANTGYGWGNQMLVLEAGQNWESTETPWVANQLVLRPSGYIGIGTSAPEAKLHVFGGSLIVSDKNRYGDRSNSAIRTDSIVPNADKGLRIYDGNSNYHISINVFGTAEIQAYGQALADAEEPSEYINLGINPKGGNVGVGTSNPLYQLDVNGIIRGDNVSPSDARWKENINSIDDALNKVTKLRGVTYDWIDQSRGYGLQIGVIAQEVEEIFPEVVHTDSQGYKSVEYAKLVAPLIEAVKELKNKNDRLEQRNSELEQRLAAIEAMLAK